MTMLGKKGDFYACAICRGNPRGIGYAPRDRAPVMWICTDCAPVAPEAYQMKPANMDQFERRAVFEAAKASMQGLTEAVMEALWNAGIRDLSAATPEALESALESMAVNGLLLDPMRAAILAFGDSVRAQLGNGEAPF